MKTSNPSKIARALVDRLGNRIVSNKSSFCPQLLQIMAEGGPVSIDQIASTLNIPPLEESTCITRLKE